MCRFIETIKIKEGVPRLLEYHQARFDKTRRDFFLDIKDIVLRKAIKVPLEMSRENVVKCRVIYGKEIEHIEFIKYIPASIKSLKLIHDDISYAYKFLDRSLFENHLNDKGSFDDILIIRNGLVTDTSFSNVIFRRETGDWITPQSTLLEGVKRQYLLDNKLIRMEKITVRDIHTFKAIKLINAMLDIEDTMEISTSRVA